MRRAVLWTIALLALAFVVQADTPPGESTPESTPPQGAPQFRIVYPSILGTPEGPTERQVMIRGKQGQALDGLRRLLESKGYEIEGQTMSWRPRTIRGLPLRPCLANEGSSGAENPCAVGEKLSRMEPCLNGKDCEALEVWKETFGPPRTVPAKPGQD